MEFLCYKKKPNIANLFNFPCKRSTLGFFNTCNTVDIILPQRIASSLLVNPKSIDGYESDVVQVEQSVCDNNNKILSRLPSTHLAGAILHSRPCLWVAPGFRTDIVRSVILQVIYHHDYINMYGKLKISKV